MALRVDRVKYIKYYYSESILERLIITEVVTIPQKLLVGIVNTKENSLHREQYAAAARRPPHFIIHIYYPYTL